MSTVAIKLPRTASVNCHLGLGFKSKVEGMGESATWPTMR